MISAYVVARKYLLAYASILIVVNNSIIYLHQFQLFLSYILQTNHGKPPHTCEKQEDSDERPNQQKFNNNDSKTGTDPEKDKVNIEGFFFSNFSTIKA